jgi:hypothetical protein
LVTNKSVIKNGENVEIKLRINDGLKLFNDDKLPVPKKAISMRASKTNALLISINVNCPKTVFSIPKKVE